MYEICYTHSHERAEGAHSHIKTLSRSVEFSQSFDLPDLKPAIKGKTPKEDVRMSRKM
jgi:hypothetical protein